MEWVAYLLRDLSSMKVSRGADQMGPWRKPTSESKTQATSSLSPGLPSLLTEPDILAMLNKALEGFLSLTASATGVLVAELRNADWPSVKIWLIVLLCVYFFVFYPVLRATAV